MGPAAARKDDWIKLRYDLIPPEALEELAQVYTMGAHKYADRNWEKGLNYGRIFAAIMRHLWAFWRGETLDKESGIHHAAHAAWGCFALITYQKRGMWHLDDRVKLCPVCGKWAVQNEGNIDAHGCCHG